MKDKEKKIVKILRKRYQLEIEGNDESVAKEILNSLSDGEDGLSEAGFCRTCSYFHHKPDWGKLGKCGRDKDTPPVHQGSGCEEYDLHFEFEDYWQPLPVPPEDEYDDRIERAEEFRSSTVV